MSASSSTPCRADPWSASALTGVQPTMGRLYGPSRRRGAPVRQRHRNVEHVVLAVLDQVDLDRLDIHVDVLADHFQQLPAQQRQVVRAAMGTALLGDNDAQAILGDR